MNAYNSEKMLHMEIDETGTFGACEDGDKAGRKPLPYLGILPVRFLVDFYLPEGTTFYSVSCAHEQRVHSVKLPYCVTVHFTYRQAHRKTSFLGAAYSIVASCLCFGEGILLQTVVKVPACLPVFALLLVSCLQLRCWKISRTVWIYQDWTLLICICTYS
ncbi:hypothetical protein WN944_017727 [Citrus x changshan-huyou]|uniref:Uncharacterized protein n=1 Tax=Citrus x changshan-huyou TaxID=2935761 RepID=A0AAP0MBS1_9ROSI